MGLYAPLCLPQRYVRESNQTRVKSKLFLNGPHTAELPLGSFDSEWLQKGMLHSHCVNICSALVWKLPFEMKGMLGNKARESGIASTT